MIMWVLNVVYLYTEEVFEKYKLATKLSSASWSLLKSTLKNFLFEYFKLLCDEWLQRVNITTWIIIRGNKVFKECQDHEAPLEMGFWERRYDI